MNIKRKKLLISEKNNLVWNVADNLRQDIFDEHIKMIKQCFRNTLKALLQCSLLSDEKRRSLERELALLECPSLVTSNISFDKKMNPIDCVVSEKKIEIVSKIIKPIKEKIISVTDLLIIGNSRVLRI